MSSVACEVCGLPTAYRLVIGDGSLHACCGRFRCEVKLRDGVDLPAPSVNDIDRARARNALRKNGGRR